MRFQVRYRAGGRWRVAGGAADVVVETTAVAPGQERVRIDASAAGADMVALAFPARPDERFFGLGEKFNRVDQRGRLVDLLVRNGAAGDETYKPVPFWMSTAGYACALETDHQAWVSLAHPVEPDWAVAMVAAPVVEAMLFVGDSLKELLERYTAWIGRPPCPPIWAFGPWKSRDWRIETAATVEEDIRQHAAHDIPCTVKLIDAGWSTEPNNFIWDRNKYPDPEGLIRRLHEQGFQVALWVCPWFIHGTVIWRELAERGYFLRTPGGDVYVHRIANAPDLLGSLLDFTHPEAVAWWQARIEELMQLGVRAIKTDFGEQVPMDAVAYDGQTGATLHNAYPRLYNGVTYAVVGRYGGLLLARSAWAGSQRYPGVWAGDQSADFAPWSGLPSVVRAGQSAGLSGFPFWASDIGGYFSGPTADCFMRWTQFGAFSPIMQVHGLGEHDPWRLGQQALENYRDFARLRMQLLPYIYTHAQAASATGVPMMRALPLEFQHDEGVYVHDFAEFQYMFGDDLLVAPVAWDSLRQRRVYLPAGTDWVDFWTGERLSGGQVIMAPAPWNRIPVYVRWGAIVPLQPAANVRELRVFGMEPGGRPSGLRLYDGTACTARPTATGAEVVVARAPADVAHRISVLGPDGRWRTAELAAGQSRAVLEFAL